MQQCLTTQCIQPSPQPSSSNLGTVLSLCIWDPDMEGRNLQGLKAGEEDHSGGGESAPFAQRCLFPGCRAGM